MITTEVKYKKTGIDWIPAIPEHWGVIRLRFLCSITTGKKNTENKEEKGKYPFIVRSQTIERINSYSYDCEGILTAGDGVGVGKVFHYVNEKFDFHQRVYLLYNFTSNINGKFLFYYLQTFLITELMRYNSKSTVDSIRLPILKDFFIPIPPQNEQSSAIEYIDSQSAKITHFIQTKQRFVELLKEQRQSIITNAVTRGIDGNVKMKETVLGNIPEHWEIRRLKNICRFKYGDSLSSKDRFDNGDIDVYGSNGIVGKHKIATTKAPCIIIGRKGSFGKINFSEKSCFPIDTTFYVDSDCTSANLEWLRYLLESLRLDRYSKDSAVPGLAREDAYVYRATYPPTIEEQKRIVEHIKTETKTLDIAICKAEREIELIKEYREAMIVEAVTGKIL